MKANELMIGDWVKVVDCPLPLQVRSIEDNEIGLRQSVLWNSSIGWSRIDRPSRTYEEEVEPIPLTKEILEKNGFKFDEFPKYAVNEIKEKTKVLFTYHSGSRTVFVSINEPNFNLLSDMVIGVHELQHILRHARIEKEIEL